MNSYKLTHHYSRLSGFFGVKSDFDLHQLNLACAYLQLIRLDLPYLPGAEDVIGEDDGSSLLISLFDMQPITEELPDMVEVDFYENWNDYCGGKLDSIESEIIGIARPGAYRAVIQSLIKNCRDSLENYWIEDAAEEKEYISKVNLSIERLNAFLNGNPVDPAWGWRTLENTPLDGRVFAEKEGLNDIPSFLTR